MEKETWKRFSFCVIIVDRVLLLFWNRKSFASGRRRKDKASRVSLIDWRCVLEQRSRGRTAVVVMVVMVRMCQRRHHQ